MKRGGGWVGRVLFGFQEKFHELRAYEVDRRGTKRRAFDKAVESEGVFVGAEREDEAAASGRGRKRTEVESRDDSERAERADEKFMKVVAGDIFDDAAAALAEPACAIHKFGADEKITRGAVGMAKRRVNTGSDDPADGGLEIKRNR